MKITILTLFPEMFDGFINNSIIKRAISKNIVSFNIVNFRNYSTDKHGRVDTPPIGGGAGLILKCQPIVDCLNKVCSKNSYKILLSPKGTKYSQQKAHNLKENQKEIVLICGHYEGVDNRISSYINEEISIGDFVLTGGELGAMVIADSVIRLLDGTIADESSKDESFENGLLEYPQYTEPYNFEGQKVPDILFSGNHQAIQKWRRKQSLKITRENRPDLFNKVILTKQDKNLINELDQNVDEPAWEIDAIEKGKKFKKEG